MPYVKGLRGYEKVTTDQLKSLRWIPENATPIEEPGLGIAYVYPARREGYYAVVAYRGNAHKADFHYIYKTDVDVDRKLQAWFDGLRDWKERIKNRRKQEYAGHSLKVGDIIYNSWGYDQTNVDWYVIVRTSTNYVWLQRVGADVTETGNMSGNSQPAVDTSDPDPSKWGVRPSGDITKHRASGDRVNMKYGSGSKWDGRTVGCSWYH